MDRITGSHRRIPLRCRSRRGAEVVKLFRGWAASPPRAMISTSYALEPAKRLIGGFYEGPPSWHPVIAFPAIEAKRALRRLFAKDHGRPIVSRSTPRSILDWGATHVHAGRSWRALATSTPPSWFRVGPGTCRVGKAHLRKLSRRPAHSSTSVTASRRMPDPDNVSPSSRSHQGIVRKPPFFLPQPPV